MITQSTKHISSNLIEISTFNEDILYTIETIDIHTCKRNGTYKEYYPDGKLWFEVDYLNGKHHGSFKQYRPDGQLAYEANYINGR